MHNATVLPTRAASARGVRLRSDAAIASWIGISTILFVLVPILVLLYVSFRSEPPGAPGGVFTIKNWLDMATKVRNREALFNTISISSVATLISMVTGTAFAWLFARTDMPARRALFPLLILPMTVPVLLLTIAWIGLASPDAGFINLLWKQLFGFNHSLLNIYSFWGIVAVLVFRFTPYVLLLLYATFTAMDVSMEEASRVLGGSPTRTFIRITLPVLAPSLFSAGLLSFVLIAEQFTVVTLLGGPIGYTTLPYAIFRATQYFPTRPNLAATYGIVLLVVMMGGMSLYHRLLRVSGRFVTVTGRGYRARLVDIGRWRYPALLACLTYLGLAVVLPYLALVVGSFLKYFTPHVRTDLLTLDNYRAVLSLSNARVVTGFKNTLLLSLVGASVTLLLTAVLAHITVRSKGPLGRLLSTAATLPLSVPPLSLAIGLLWMFLYLPIGIYGTIWVLFFAYYIRFMGQSTRIISSNILQISPELEDAARVLGASRMRSFRDITLPLIRRAAVSAWILLLILMSLEISVTLFLSTGKTQTLAVVLWHAANMGEFPEAMALSVVSATVIFVLVGIGQRAFGLLSSI